MKARNILLLLFAVGISLLAGAVGSLFTMSAVESWYPGLMKPLLTPPDWLFGPVWTVLYVLMGVAFFLVLKEGWKKKCVRVSTWVFIISLVLNALWSILFFGVKSLFGAGIEIAFLWFSIWGVLLLFHDVKKQTIWLILPYLLWVSFASYLNFAICFLN